MYSLDELFRGSTHKASAFTPEAVKWLEDSVFMKPSRSGEVPYVKCIICKKDIRLTPEEAVRQLYVYDLIHVEGYAEENIKLEHPVHFGREVKRADIVIFERKHPDSEYIIVEVKKPKLLEGKAQLKSYCNATGALIGVWTNGEITEWYHRKDPNYFEKIKRLPNAHETLKDVIGERWTIADLERENKLKDGKTTLKDIVTDIEDEILANAGGDVFDEVFKLIFTKLYDEMKSVRNEKRLLEFGNYGDTDEDLMENIQSLFDLAKEEWQGVFTADEKITLQPSHLAVCVSSLQDVKLFNSNLDVVDDAFEFLMTKSSKGEKGQFFTPRYVIDMCVRMLNPSEDESMIDTAAGSCGFPVHTMFYVWGKIYDRLGLPRRNMFTAEKKPEECTDYVRKKVFAIDFDPKVVKVARTLNLIAGDGQTNVMLLNTLDYMNWDEVTKSQDWIDIYSVGWKGLRGLRAEKKSNLAFMFDIVMANPPFAGDVKEGKIISQYELAKGSKGKYVSKIGRDILFIERNLQFLKPGGRMAIILPQGRFNNSSDKYIRDFIAERCRILAVIGLHVNVFKPHTGTKTSVLLVQKWDEELCPRQDNYQIFFANMHKPSKDNSGEKIYRKDSEGHILLDEHYHPIVEHDLFNVKGLTEDGVVEAFIEFAKREGFSFFAEARLLKPFDEERYTALMDGLKYSEVSFSEVMSSTEYFRLEAEYFNSQTFSFARMLKGADIIGGIQYGTSKLCDEDDSGYPVLRLNELDNGFINTPQKFCHTLSYDEVEALSLRKDDVLVIRTNGNPNLVGRAAVVMEDTDCAFASYLFRVFANGRINPCTIVAFMNGKYGRMEIDKHSMKGNQTNFSPAKFRDMMFPELSKTLQDKVQDMFEQAYSYRSEADMMYDEAQEILSEAMHFDSMPSSQQNTAIVSFSTVFSTGRLDAEYFMPQYDDILSQLNDADTVAASCRIHNTNFTPQNGTQYKYIELADVGTYGNITGSTIADGQDLPTRARRIVHAGQVIISSIEGSLQSCALITDEYDGALCSTGFYVIDSDEYNPETLLLLFKSELIQTLLKRGCSGTILAAISEDELRQIRLPRIDRDTQNTIASLVQHSFSLRRKSQHLINAAVKSVELAIESSEQSAINFITQEVNQ